MLPWLLQLLSSPNHDGSPVGPLWTTRITAPALEAMITDRPRKAGRAESDEEWSNRLLFFKASSRNENLGRPAVLKDWRDGPPGHQVEVRNLGWLDDLLQLRVAGEVAGEADAIWRR